MANRLFLGLDLGGTNVKAGVVDDHGNALASISVATQAILGPVKGVEQIVRAGREAVVAAGVDLADISAVGLATPGTMDIPGGCNARQSCRMMRTLRPTVNTGPVPRNMLAACCSILWVPDSGAESLSTIISLRANIRMARSWAMSYWKWIMVDSARPANTAPQKPTSARRHC